MRKIFAFLVVAALLATAALCAFSASAAGKTNIALGKNYTGGEPSTHDAVKKYNAKLTDGRAANGISYDGEWFAFYYNADATGTGNINAPDRVGTIVIDLEQAYNVGTVKVNAFLGNASGIVAPSSVKVEVSVDGTSYTQLGSTATFDKPANDDATVDWIVISGDAVEGRYVKVTVAMDPYAPYAFLNEIEVYEADASGDDAGDDNGEDDKQESSASTPATSESDSSSSSAPPMGDEGMIVFALLAVLAIAGSFAVIRARR